MSLKDSVLAKIGGICNAFGASIQDVVDILNEKLSEEKKKPETKQKIQAKSEELTEEKEEKTK